MSTARMTNESKEIGAQTEPPKREADNLVKTKVRFKDPSIQRSAVSIPSSIRCLVIGDPHIKITEIKASLEMTQAIVDLARREQPDFIVCLGDTLDRHETIHSQALTIATQWLYQLTDVAKVYLLIGNHDRPNNQDFLSDQHPFVGLKGWSSERICVVDHVVADTINGLNFFFVPYVPPGRFTEALETLDAWKQEFIWTAGFTHQEFYGVQLAPSIFSEKGDHWPKDYPLLINGHIHDRGYPQANIINIGTPRQHDFDESLDKSVSMFTFNKIGGYEETRLPLPIPYKIMLRLTASEFNDWQIPSSLKDYLKIEVSGTKAEITALRHLDKIKKVRSFGIKVVTRDSEAGLNKKNKEIPLPPKEWSQKSFRHRLALRAQHEGDEIKQVYSRLFEKKTEFSHKVVIKRKK